jgi:hypothetical protein
MQNQLARLAFLFVLFGLALIPTVGHAQATRTWVSGVGDDANPCSRTAPCKTLAGAISKTAANGIINLLDPAAVGALTITKSITVQMDEEFAGVLASATNGIIINAGVGDTVVLRGLSINGSGGTAGVTGLNGVRILQAGAVRIENCDIRNFLESGIEVANTSALKLSVLDSTIQNILATGASANANDAGIAIVPTGAGTVRAVFDRVRILGTNQFGINATGNTRLIVRDSVISAVVGSAVRIDGTAGANQAIIDKSALVDNTVNGILSNGSAAIARVSSSIITGHTTAMVATNSGQIISFGNNSISGNGNNGTSTSTTPLL